MGRTAQDTEPNRTFLKPKRNKMRHGWMANFVLLISLFITATTCSRISNSAADIPFDCPEGCHCTIERSDSRQMRNFSLTCMDVPAMPALPRHDDITRINISFTGYPGISSGAFRDMRGIRLIHLSGEIGEIYGGAIENITGSFYSIRQIPIPTGEIIIKQANISTIHSQAFVGLSGFAGISFEDSYIGE